MKVRELAEILREDGFDFKMAELVGIVKELRSSGSVELSEARPRFSSFWVYMLDFQNFAFWWTTSLIALSGIFVFLLPQVYPWLLGRYVFVTISIIISPGYSLSRILYPRRNENGLVEKLALSLGLSVAFLVVIGLLLNSTSQGITVLLTETSVFLLVPLLSLLATCAEYRQA